jgi:hypothetical protein
VKLQALQIQNRNNPINISGYTADIINKKARYLRAFLLGLVIQP